MSTSKNYSRGAAFERYWKKELERDPDCILVIRSAGSHGPIDLIGLFRDPSGHGRRIEVRGYQLKTGTSFNITSEEIAFLQDLNSYYDIYTYVIFRTKHPCKWGHPRDKNGYAITEYRTMIWSPEEAMYWATSEKRRKNLRYPGKPLLPVKEKL